MKEISFRIIWSRSTALLSALWVLRRKLLIQSSFRVQWVKIPLIKPYIYIYIYVILPKIWGNLIISILYQYNIISSIKFHQIKSRWDLIDARGDWHSGKPWIWRTIQRHSITPIIGIYRSYFSSPSCSKIDWEFPWKTTPMYTGMYYILKGCAVLSIAIRGPVYTCKTKASHISN